MLIELSQEELDSILDAISVMTPTGEEPSAAWKTLQQAAANPVMPTVAIGMEGDWVQGSTANTPITIVLIDHDRDDSDQDKVRNINCVVDVAELVDLLGDEPSDCAEIRDSKTNALQSAHGNRQGG